MMEKLAVRLGRKERRTDSKQSIPLPTSSTTLHQNHPRTQYHNRRAKGALYPEAAYSLERLRKTAFHYPRRQQQKELSLSITTGAWSLHFLTLVER
ncbi:hypothetical protein TNCT_324121 [Trichonephila clavata]|uniref:Uncharacterized protein n=1 Tax=Trichonephila clavata TaxID=2740835 RepID=A0A8X6LGL1_TRICU|nr:hypothetical protein TNCT_324121 [Trichonephila clavata]